VFAFVCEMSPSHLGVNIRTVLQLVERFIEW